MNNRTKFIHCHIEINFLIGSAVADYWLHWIRFFVSFVLLFLKQWLLCHRSKILFSQSVQVNGETETLRNQTFLFERLYMVLCRKHLFCKLEHFTWALALSLRETWFKMWLLRFFFTMLFGYLDICLCPALVDFYTWEKKNTHSTNRFHITFSFPPSILPFLSESLVSFSFG